MVNYSYLVEFFLEINSEDYFIIYKITDLSVPLGGKSAWPSHAISQPALSYSSPLDNNLLVSQVPMNASVTDSAKMNQRIDELKTWLRKAQQDSLIIPEK